MIMKIAIEKLKSSGRNPRKITKAAIERLKKSISENPDFFKARPILVNHVGDDYVIIGGHQRHKIKYNATYPKLLLSNENI